MPARYRLAAFAAALLLPIVCDAQSTVYRWVDKNGKVQYSDTPPTQDTKDVTQKRLGGGAVEAPQLPFATQQAMKNAPAILYVAQTCGELCDRSRELLSRRGIPFGERDVSNAADAETVRKLIGSVGVPVLTLGEKVLKGYSEDSWHAALDTAGYPRTALPGQVNPKPPTPAAPATSAPAVSQPPASNGAPRAAEPAK